MLKTIVLEMAQPIWTSLIQLTSAQKIKRMSTYFLSCVETTPKTLGFETHAFEPFESLSIIIVFFYLYKYF